MMTFFFFFFFFYILKKLIQTSVLKCDIYQKAKQSNITGENEGETHEERVGSKDAAPHHSCCF